MVIDRPMLLIA